MDSNKADTLDRSVYNPNNRYAENNSRGPGDILVRTWHFSNNECYNNRSFENRKENYQANNLTTTLNSDKNETTKEHEEPEVVLNSSDNAEIHDVETEKQSQEKSL